ncbi:extracellular solute-binding protein [Paenibacillus sp. J5C_2022]|uniref:ABC transporter substrate-binding protein n=1 Tax=Paenibacillus sp. J5C2022 TaxID=2977129 RepID=UPI0021D00F91|nr:extracellular solute-binding protein [Paenibacillus sp. J5C2022]MCU6712940.1 extracellular solute-binding protein [Paenibacillus sp. J5C2022]
MRQLRLRFIQAVALVLVLSLAACSGNGNHNASSSNGRADGKPGEGSGQTPGSTEPQAAKITWWAAWNEADGPADIIKEFNKKYPHIEIEYVKFSNNDEGNVKIDTSLLAGLEIDVLMNFGLPRFIPRAEKGLLLDLTEYIQRDKLNMEEEFGSSVNTTDGKYFGLPASSLSNVVYFNETMLEAAGLQVPAEWTLEDYKEYARKMTSGEGANKIYGASDYAYVGLYYWTMPARGLLGDNAWFKSDNEANFDHPVYKRALEFKYNLENVEKIQFPYTEFKASKTLAEELFVQGKVAMTAGSNSLTRFLKNEKDYPHDFRTTIAPLPMLDRDQDINYNKGLYPFSYLAINAKTKEKEASWTFAKWLATEGSIFLAKVGHIPSWTKTDKNALADAMLGPNADKIMDVEAFKNVLLDYDSPAYKDTRLKAYSEVNAIIQGEAEKYLFDQISLDEAIANMKKNADDALQK